MAGKPLNISGQVTLALSGGVVTGRVVLGPGLNGDRGPATWIVDGVILKTTRPGTAPIPRAEVFLDDPLNSGASQGVTYDGSFDQGPTNITLTRGQTLTAVWTGGNAGDVATFILSGTKQ